jgi:hypothetical protein
LSTPNNPNVFSVLKVVDDTISPPNSYEGWARVLLSSLWATTVRGLLPLAFFFSPLPSSSTNTPMHVVLGPAYMSSIAQALQVHLEAALQLLAPCMQSAAATGGAGAADRAATYLKTHERLQYEIKNACVMHATGGQHVVSTGGNVRGVDERKRWKTCCTPFCSSWGGVKSKKKEEVCDAGRLGDPVSKPPSPAILKILSAINSIPWLDHATAETLRAERLLSLSPLNPSTSSPSAPLKLYIDAKNVEGCMSVRVSHVDQEAWFTQSKSTAPVATNIDLTGLGVSEEFTVATSDNPFVQVLFFFLTRGHLPKLSYNACVSVCMDIASFCAAKFELIILYDRYQRTKRSKDERILAGVMH